MVAKATMIKSTVRERLESTQESEIAMNNNQIVFSAVTGFEASYKPMGAAQEYNTADFEEIYSVVKGTVDNAEFLGLEINHSGVNVDEVTEAIFKFHNCDAAQGSDLDCIFNSLS